ncbi:MAG: linear amide C-N hydrolase [Sumerlaeia bacterium]
MQRITASLLSLSLGVVLSFCSYYSANACTNFSFLTGTNTAFHAQNYDWEVGNGVLVYNPPRIQKKGLGKEPPTWTSQYPSLTFNQYGLEFPVGGMNSQGVTIGVMWLAETTYPDADPERPSIEPLQWVQYQLDNAGSVAEAVELAETLTVRPIFGAQIAIHFLLSDSTGDSAVVEFIAGKQIIYHGETLITSVLTNTPYDRCVNSLADYSSFGGKQPSPASYGSIERFIQMSEAVEAKAKIIEESVATEQAFRSLKQVSDEFRTVWSIVYNQKTKTINFITVDNQNVRTVSFSDFSEVNCSARALAVDLNAPLQGDIRSYFRPYEKNWNVEVARKSFAKTPHTMLMPADLVKGLANFPYDFTCDSLSKQVQSSTSLGGILN